nr:Gag-Pol polyprotein [Tanacetum cinerariifolium]
PYVRRMTAEPGDGERDVNVNETFHEQTNDELSEIELKQIEADDQAIQTILHSLPEEIYAAVDTFKLNYSTPTNNNQRISSNPKSRQIAQPGMNMGQDRQMQMIGGNGGN